MIEDHSPPRGIHDIGGLPAGAVERAEHASTLSEKRVDAIMVLLIDKGLLRVDELRRGIESLGAEAYDRLSYYERWISSITNIMVEKGVLDRAEIDRRMAAVKERWEAAE